MLNQTKSKIFWRWWQFTIKKVYLGKMGAELYSLMYWKFCSVKVSWDYHNTVNNHFIYDLDKDFCGWHSDVCSNVLAALEMISVYTKKNLYNIYQVAVPPWKDEDCNMKTEYPADKSSWICQKNDQLVPLYSLN